MTKEEYMKVLFIKEIFVQMALGTDYLYKNAFINILEVLQDDFDSKYNGMKINYKTYNQDYIKIIKKYTINLSSVNFETALGMRFKHFDYYLIPIGFKDE
ncbi:hypothetical protein RCIP0023_00308 [Klebsiella phage RCIP0023]